MTSRAFRIYNILQSASSSGGLAITDYAEMFRTTLKLRQLLWRHQAHLLRQLKHATKHATPLPHGTNLAPSCLAPYEALST